MRKRTNTSKKELAIYGIVTLALLSCEAMLTWMLAIDTLSLISFLVGHAAVSAISISLWMWSYTAKRDTKFTAILALLTSTLGVFGTAICFMCQILYLIYSRNAVEFKDWYARLFPEHNDTSTNKLYERLILGRDDFSEKTDVIPFMDVITLGSEEQKRTALDKVVRHFRPEFSPILLKAIDDPSNAIRVQAATIIARLEHSFSQKTSRLLKQLKKSPNNRDLAKNLAKHYDAYAHSGFLMDAAREQLLRNKAIKLYEEYLTKYSEDIDARFYLSKLYMREKKLDEAYTLLKSCVNRKDGHKTVPSNIIWLALECLFHMHRFQELKAVADVYFPLLDPDNPEDFDLLEMIKFWGGGISLPEDEMRLEYE